MKNIGQTKFLLKSKKYLTPITDEGPLKFQSVNSWEKNHLAKAEKCVDFHRAQKFFRTDGVGECKASRVIYFGLRRRND